MMNWKNTVSKLNARAFAFPAGWDTRDTIAAQLDCSPDRVDTFLGPGLKSGEIEKQQFPVWDARLGRKVLIWGYRQAPAKPDPAAPSKTAADPASPLADPALLARVRDLIRRHPDKRPSQIADLVRSTRHPRLRAADIAPLMK